MLLNLIGVVFAFCIIIILIRKKMNFGLTLLLGSLILGIFNLENLAPFQIFNKIIDVSIYSIEKNEFYTETLELSILMILIYILAKAMQDTKAIEKLINSLRTIFKKGGLLAIIPAIYGFRPFPSK